MAYAASLFQATITACLDIYESLPTTDFSLLTLALQYSLNADPKHLLNIFTTTEDF